MPPGQPHNPSNAPAGHHSKASTSGQEAAANAEKQPKISLPKGGGAIQGIGEKFQVNPVTGTGSLTIPIAMSPGRSGFTPQLALSYDSGAGNSPFGMGWSVGLPSISRKTQKGLPRYLDYEESDVFLLSGAEDLVPVLTKQSDGTWKNEKVDDEKYTVYDGQPYDVYRYRPRIEGLFARIEKWTNPITGHTFWKSITKENITTIYGQKNITTIHGQSGPTQIYHPEDEGLSNRRVFKWLIERTFDDKGNIIYYQYKDDEYTEENKGNFPNTLPEKNRKRSDAFSQKYLKKVFYGNTKPYVSGGISHDEPDWGAWDGDNQWLFELIFDYGEHQSSEHDIPTYEALQPWPHRPDIFSSFRSGFDIRTYRLCQRVLMFHHFEGELEVKDYLVRSTDLQYKKHPIGTKLESVSHTSYRYKADADGSYEKASMPEVSFKYSGLPFDDDLPPEFEIEEVALEYLDNLPQGIDGNRYRWQDLYGEGIGGILTQSKNAWYYKPNLGEAQFGALEQVAEIPAIANLFAPEQQLVDLGGDGQQNLVIQSRSLSGYYEIDEERHWKNFRSFESNANLNWRDPNLRLIDLTGDGHADLLITENDCFVWSHSLAEKGFEAAQRVCKAFEEENGPRIVFNDGTESIYLADMTGDGLIDILRIKKNNIYYWANKGYGKFSRKIEMDNAPQFDQFDHFNQRNIRLADIDGSGTTDIFYLGKSEVYYWHNESGNSWCDTHLIPNFPHIDNLATVQVLDLKGKGTASLVWSSPLPGESPAPLKYIDLMQEKPHLLIEVNNHMGATTKLEYKPSTYFYLQDKKANKPWITKIPFPVHVLVRQETHDEISGNSFVARYAYHHGYFDGIEREFRGFGMVEQWDTEDYLSIYNESDRPRPRPPEVNSGQALKGSAYPQHPTTNWSEETDVPPVHTKTWFHTGAFVRQDQISEFFKTVEYYKKDLDAWPLGNPALLDECTSEEQREACRALKGSILRQEIYALDREPKSIHPYSVTESNYTIQRLQPKGDNHHAVFLVTPRETLTYHYERNPVDPRIAQTANLNVDEFGNVTHTAAIVYPRRGKDHPIEQLTLYTTLSENILTHPADQESWYRHSLPLETRAFEVHGLETQYDEKGKMKPFILEDLRSWLYLNFKKAGKNEIDLNLMEEGKILDYAQKPYGNDIQLRLLKRSLIRYFRNSLDGPLGFDEDPESLAIPYESYTLAFTKGILDQNTAPRNEPPTLIRDKITEGLLRAGGYLSNEDLLGKPEEAWWLPSGRTLFFYSAEIPEDIIVAKRFYLPVGEKTPLGKENDTTSAAQESYLFYDHFKDGVTDSYYLFVEKADDPLKNTLRVVDFDYRVLQARTMEDINNNRSEVAFDIHGMVIATAIKGKVDENNESEEGDELSDFREIVCKLDSSYLQLIMEAPKGYLGNATTYFHYDLFAWQRDQEPPFAIGLSREQHYRELPKGEELKIQKSVVYSDGFGREILTKVQAEPGLAPQRDETGELVCDTSGAICYIDTCPEAIPTCPEHNPDYPYRRWVGNGRTLFNNKGKPVKQYEPFFDSGYRFTEEDELRKWGVTPVIHYDPLTRVIRTDLPDGTFSKVEFSPWHQVSYDPIDTLEEATDEEKGWYQDKMGREVDQELLNRYSSYPTEQKNRIVNAIVAGDHAAARKSFALKNTPSWQFLDTLGRPFVAIAHNRIQAELKDDKTPQQFFIPTRTELDIEGNPLFIFDGRRSKEIKIAWDSYAESAAPEPPPAVIAHRGNQVMNYAYAMNGLQLYQNSMDAGESWELMNVMGNPVHSWSYQTVDEYGHPEYIHTWSEYDDLQRPTHLWVKRMTQEEKLVENLVYGEGHPHGLEHNLRGELILHLDGAGLIQNKVFDFKGNLEEGSRYLAKDYENIEVDWQDLKVEELITGNPIDHPSFDGREYRTVNSFDALSRVVETETPDGSKTIYAFNEAGLLDKVRGKLPNLKGDGKDFEEVTFVENIDYNAKGQRERIRYGNQVITRYTYDPKTFRLERLWSFRSNGESLQDIAYTYDAVGNITQIYDIAQPTIFNDNKKVEPKHTYTYNSQYQLIEAFGRESKLIERAPGNKETIAAHLVPNIPISDAELRSYREYYTYDEAGNILHMQHVAKQANWTRKNSYETHSNRLIKSTPKYCDRTVAFHYDHHGNMADLPHLHRMDWDYKDQLQGVGLVPECTEDDNCKSGQREVFFTYDASRQRVRKRFHAGNSIKERIYLGNFELYRLNGVIDFAALQTLHVSDDTHRICMVETTEEGKRYYRYQLSNHLGSASIELDENAAILTYEEYHPYGTSALRARKSKIDISSKRYRYTGMERDEETGLNYHTARYYLPWLGRWGSCDPIEVVQISNLFIYSRNSPLNRIDPNGKFDIYTNQGLTDMFMGYFAKAWGYLFEGTIGGKESVNENTFYMPKGGLGGWVGGVLHTLTGRQTGLLEDIPSPVSRAGTEAGARFPIVEHLDDLLRVATAETVSGYEASRWEASFRLLYSAITFGITLKGGSTGIPQIPTTTGATSSMRAASVVSKVDDLVNKPSKLTGGINLVDPKIKSFVTDKKALVTRALRKANEGEDAIARAVEKSIKRGDIKLEFHKQLKHDGKEVGGLHPIGTRKAQVSLNAVSMYKKRASAAAGIAGHEARHVMQKLSKGAGRGIHEVQALIWQKHIFQKLRVPVSDNFIMKMFEKHYKNLKWQ